MVFRITVAIILFHVYPTLANQQYLHWFPQWHTIFSQIIQQDCSSQYGDYLRPHPDSNAAVNGALNNCILQNIDEMVKQNMQSAAVLLGLTPTILSLIGSSTAETSIVSLRRPLLALLLAAGSPSVNPIRAFEWYDPVRALLSSRSDSHLPFPPNVTDKRWKKWAITAIEFAIAFVAVANVVEMGYRLGYQTSCAFAAETVFHPLVWTVAAIPVHMCGSIALRLRVQDNYKPRSDLDPKGLPPTRLAMASGSLPWTFRKEVYPYSSQPPMELKWKRESISFLIVSGWTSLGTVLHIVYGTLVFSSMLFISTQDALGVVARYLASALVCRMVLVYELAGIRTVPVDVDSQSKT